MSRKHVVAALMLAGVAALLYSRRSEASVFAVEGDAPFYLNKNTTSFDKPPADSGSWNFGLNLYDIFGDFYSDGISEWRKQNENTGNPNYDPDSVVPYDVQRTTSGVSQSFFDRAVDAVASVGGAVAYSINLPRGIRNNNPGNIRTNAGKSQQPFDGAIPIAQNTDANKAFMQFENPWYGIRAAARVMLNYQKNYGLSTLRQMITRYAPPAENDTEGYIKYVCSRLGVTDSEFYNVSDWTKLAALKRLMVLRENSYEYSDSVMFDDACRAAIDNHACPGQWQGRWDIPSVAGIFTNTSNVA